MSEPYEVSDEELLRRIVKGAYSRRKPRWVHIMDIFLVGSTYAHLICHRFGFEPDEMKR